MKYTLNRNGILIRKSMFIARIMALLTKEKNTTETYCSPSSMRNLFLYGPNQGSLCTTNILFPTHPAWTLLYIYLSNQRVKLSHSVSGSKINRKIYWQYSVNARCQLFKLQNKNFDIPGPYFLSIENVSTTQYCGLYISSFFITDKLNFGRHTWPI